MRIFTNGVIPALIGLGLSVASAPAAKSLESHTLTVVSSEPLTMRLPSGENATELTWLV